jgi:uncharacterized OsmC-like protein
MSTTTTFDGFQHATGVRVPQGNSVAMDCPYTGKGEELSPGNLVEAALAGCMLISMGTLALRHPELDIMGAKMDVSLNADIGGAMRYTSVDVAVTMPRVYTDKQRTMLERAADSCPIKHALDIPVNVSFRYPEAPAAQAS